jgi:hypothetical protein
MALTDRLAPKEQRRMEATPLDTAGKWQRKGFHPACDHDKPTICAIWATWRRSHGTPHAVHGYTAA